MGLITGPLRRRAKRHFAGIELLRGNGTLALSEKELLEVGWLEALRG